MRFSRSQRRGFTLVEILTVVSIFAVTSLIATNIFVITSRFQRKAAISQKLQGDIRFAVEAIAREVRFGTIDYDCYNDPALPNCDPWSSSNDLMSNSGRMSLLALKDVDGIRTRYRVSPVDDRLYVCSLSTTELDTACDDPPPGNVKWQPVSPADIRVVRGAFYLFPFTNPYALTNPVLLDGSPYTADAQPRVTIVLATQQTLAEISPERASLQTTVTSRLYLR